MTLSAHFKKDTGRDGQKPLFCTKKHTFLGSFFDVFSHFCPTPCRCLFWGLTLFGPLFGVPLPFFGVPIFGSFLRPPLFSYFWGFSSNFHFSPIFGDFLRSSLFLYFGDFLQIFTFSLFLGLSPIFWGLPIFGIPLYFSTFA